jgi:hypothetical protein
MLRVMLPLVALPSLAPVNVPVGRSVGVSVEIIVVVDVDVATVPIAIAPMAAPGTPGGSAKRNSRAPHQCRPRYVPRIRVRIVRIFGCRRTVNDRWIVRGNVHDVRVSVLYYDHLFAALDCFGLNCLLRAGL